MEENTSSAAEQKSTPNEKTKEKMKRNILCPVLVVLALLAGGGAYYWRDNQANNNRKTDRVTISNLENKVTELEKQVAESKKTSNDTSTTNNTNNKTETSCAATLPTATVKENVIASITSKNTAAIASYSAPKIRVVLAASEAAFDRTPDEAVKDIEYVINAQEPWNFALSAATLNSYKAGPYKDYFKENSVVGVAKDKKVIVFNFNCVGNGKIDGIFMAASSDLLTE